jgi:PIN domain nuclease of toxin-antitoxin system
MATRSWCEKPAHARLPAVHLLRLLHINQLIPFTKALPPDSGRTRDRAQRDENVADLPGGAVLDACQSPANSLHLSLASVWELQIKMQLGKLALRLPLADVLRDQQQQNGRVLESVTLDDILALSLLSALHRDPFDRLIIAGLDKDVSFSQSKDRH